MVKGEMAHIIMPVKDSIQTAQKAIRAIVASGYTLCVYDDFSSSETASRLDSLQSELGIEVVHLSERVNTPSPNYRWVLIEAQRKAIAQGQDLVIVESDVIVKPDTMERLMAKGEGRVGMVAAVTQDEEGNINFPYEYARHIRQDGACPKRLSFCCTLLTNELLRAYDFVQLDEKKNWYDVHISRMSRQLGFVNILQVSNPVVHLPHSSRPWKQLKYSHPLVYYWRKLTQRRDRI